MPIKFNFCFLFFIFCFFSACSSDDGKLINGRILPDIVLPNLQGDTIKLSSIEHKIVLVEFWASWCKPCRVKHPELNRIYNQYKDLSFKGGRNGFEIYYISLDDYESLWRQAMEKDGIDNWKYHVADLIGMKKSTLPLSFQFTQIPTAFLIDENGIIIGKDISENRLEFELKERVVN